MPDIEHWPWLNHIQTRDWVTVSNIMLLSAKTSLTRVNERMSLQKCDVGGWCNSTDNQSNVFVRLTCNLSLPLLSAVVLRRLSCHVHPQTLTPPPPRISYALVQATVGIGTVIIVHVIYLRTKCSAAT